MRSKHTVDNYPHYIFTPRDITSWILGLLRYDITEGSSDSSESLLKIWAYQAKRQFGDRLVGKESRDKFDSTLISTLRNDWSLSIDTLDGMYYVTWGSAGGIANTGNVAGSFGRPVGLLSKDDFKQIVSKGLTAFGKSIYLMSIKLIDCYGLLLFLVLLYKSIVAYRLGKAYITNSGSKISSNLLLECFEHFGTFWDRVCAKYTH